MNENNKRGYLKEDFKFFHLKDKKSLDLEFHYHDFNKIIIFLSGNVTYLIEGKAYKLKPWDILFVSSGEIHKPLIDSKQVYDRIVIWINHEFIESHNKNGCNLLNCFSLTKKRKLNILRLDGNGLEDIKYTLDKLDDTCSIEGFGNEILKNALFLELMVYLNRLFMNTYTDKNQQTKDVQYDETVNSLLDYINENLSKDLSIDKLSSIFYVSKYYLMHKFKEQTGYTIHSYIQKKRLIKASEFIKSGKPVTQVYLECGFGDYSNFVRAFKKNFGYAPKEYYKKRKSSYNTTNIEG
ncbi:AraC family transcriptional regulator [Haloimpatiens lingqiaonensis]|uniref:AraC family transcriptional regulator n=1 Tax=Haloimpatiens lingqiaonensis TaxID=1380675 RepID=UPI0010FDE275|nr:AraC family transcriptional regulator [Haloimpatiens lingqiaonensis]